MSRTAAEILDEARQLPPLEREWVAHGLLIESADEIDAAWAAEVERRAATASADAPANCSWEELEARLRAKLTA